VKLYDGADFALQAADEKKKGQEGNGQDCISRQQWESGEAMKVNPCSRRPSLAGNSRTAFVRSEMKWVHSLSQTLVAWGWQRVESMHRSVQPAIRRGILKNVTNATLLNYPSLAKKSSPAELKIFCQAKMVAATVGLGSTLVFSEHAF
jgi:hypothetical protein